MRQCLVVAAGASLLACLAGSLQATPITITGQTSASTSGLGNFSATLSYTPGTSTSGTLGVSMTNTSPVANGGFITAFVFNASGGVSGVSAFASSDPDFGLIGGPTFNDSINGQPFGDFDIGASTGGAFQGGGPPSLGIAVGATETFAFTLTGTGLPTGAGAEDAFLNSLLSTYSTPRGGDTAIATFVVRFRGFNNGGSDKVPGVGPGGQGGAQEIPEPGSLVLWGMVGLGLAGGFLARRRLAKA